MRILMTTDTVGGVWTFTREFTQELLALHCAVALVSVGNPPSPEQREWVAALTNIWGDRFYFASCDAPLEWMDDNRRAYDAAAPLLLQIAASFGAEILLSNQYCFGALPCGIPRIVVAHSDVLSWADACRPEGLEPSRWLDQYKSLVSDGLSEAAAVVAPTRWMLDALAAHFALPTRSFVISNGRSPSLPRIRPQRQLQAVAAGRLWDTAKGIATLNDIHSPMPVLVAGSDEHASSRFHPMPNLRCLGALAERDLLHLFLQSSVYLCTSIYEPFGLAPLEAALCGCAVIARDIPSLREVWQQGALFFDDADSLSALLQLLADNPALRARSRRRSWKRAHELSAKRMATAYLQLFCVLLNKQFSSEANAA